MSFIWIANIAARQRITVLSWIIWEQRTSCRGTVEALSPVSNETQKGVCLIVNQHFSHYSVTSPRLTVPRTYQWTLLYRNGFKTILGLPSTKRPQRRFSPTAVIGVTNRASQVEWRKNSSSSWEKYQLKSRRRWKNYMAIIVKKEPEMKWRWSPTSYDDRSQGCLGSHTRAGFPPRTWARTTSFFPRLLNTKKGRQNIRENEDQWEERGYQIADPSVVQKRDGELKIFTIR